MTSRWEERAREEELKGEEDGEERVSESARGCGLRGLVKTEAKREGKRRDGDRR